MTTRLRSDALEALTPGLDIDVSLDGEFAPDVPDHARKKVRAALRHCHGPVLRASVRIIRYRDPALARPVVSRAIVNVNGRLVRVQTTADSARAGLDALQDVLRTAIERLDRHHDHRHDRTPRAPRSRDVDDRVVYEHTTRAPIAATVDEAIADLDTLDREFHLFVDADTGEDTVVYRGGPTGYRLAQVHRVPLGCNPATAVSIGYDSAARLSLTAAEERLSCSGQPFLFYADVETGRGAVLYWRRDGDYGLVALPAE